MAIVRQENDMNQQETMNEILSRISKGKPSLHLLPDVPAYRYRGDPVEDFIEHLLGFDGRVVEFKTRADAIKWLNNQPEMDIHSHLIYSSVPDITGNFTDSALADLRNAHKINVCVTESDLGVGEMGAVWVTDASLKYAACALLSRRLFILLDGNHIIGGLHEAYATIKPAEHQYGSFYTGPSATADIEAVHITGAQGPLLLTALIFNRPDAPDKPLLRVNPAADASKWAQAMEND